MQEKYAYTQNNKMFRKQACKLLGLEGVKLQIEVHPDGIVVSAGDKTLSLDVVEELWLLWQDWT